MTIVNERLKGFKPLICLLACSNACNIRILCTCSCHCSSGRDYTTRCIKPWSSLNVEESLCSIIESLANKLKTIFNNDLAFTSTLLCSLNDCLISIRETLNQATINVRNNLLHHCSCMLLNTKNPIRKVDLCSKVSGKNCQLSVCLGEIVTQGPQAVTK